ncbi:hypothetical protein PHLGIDRAFT_534841, partial [Phlebiopsis gigantea 11061_1 CR5-6]
MDGTALGQVVLATLDGGDSGKSIWLDERAVPSVVAMASLLTLLARGVWPSKSLRGLSPDRDRENEVLGGHFLTSRGGMTILIFKVTRLVAVMALFCLWGIAAIKNERDQPNIALLMTILYAVLLALLNVLAPIRRTLPFSRHLSMITFATLAVYTYRNVWPLMTFTLRPKDLDEGAILWGKLGLLAFAAVFLPLLEPYTYIPYDPSHPSPVPNSEQTASIASFLTYVWLDSIIWRAHQVPHLPHDDLPPICDYDEVKNLIKQGYTGLDPFSGAKPTGSLFWPLAKMFRWTLLYQAFAVVMVAASQMTVPVGTNRLLTYLEHGGEGAIVKPWVWILWLGLGPVVKTIFFQLYAFLGTRMLVRIQSIFTSLILDHALRIRMKAETSERQVTETAPGDSQPGTALQSEGSDGGDVRTVSSQATAGPSTAVSRASTASTATVVASVSELPKGTDKNKPESKGAEKLGEKNKKKDSNLVGKLNNLVTSDLDNILGGLLYAPTLSILSIWFLYAILGWSSLVGLAVMIILFPAPSWVAARTNGIQKEKMKATDARVQSVTEVMSVLRMIKLFGWETRVFNNVSEQRETELKLIWKRKLLDLLNTCLANIIPLLHMVITYAIYTVVMNRQLTAAVVFSSVTAFSMFRRQMHMIMFYLPSMLNANVSLKRVADFLRNTELLDSFITLDEPVVDSTWAHGSDIGFGQADFSWSQEKTDGNSTPSRRTFRLRIDEEVKFKEGAFNLVIGPTGSGKTSMLMALLGEMHYMPRSPESWLSLPRHGGIAFAAQESWVQNDTIKGNILFGAPYDEERYKKVLYQCALVPDLRLFEAGDATEVGEKGITLSGGQKARLTLARAVYSSARILLLDDVLAALDVHTSRWIVNRCFKGDLIRGRTVVFVTHNIAMASPLADFVISLRDGHIVSQGTISDALTKDQQLAEEFKLEEEVIELEEDAVDLDEANADPVSTPTKKESTMGKLVVAEEIAIGRISWKAYRLLLTSLGGSWPLVFWVQYLGGDILSTASTTFESWWLGHWARQYSLRDPNDVRVSFYLGIYIAIVVLSILAMVYSTVTYTYGGMRASRSVHAKLVKSLLSSTFRWLDVTPTSRVITRCTQDIQAVDGPIPSQMKQLLSITISLIISISVVVLYTPVFLVPALLISFLGGLMGNIYIKAQLSMKREMSNAKAPVLDVFGSATSSLTSIRAYAAQTMFRDTLHDRIDRYTRASRAMYNVNRWINMRLDTLGQLFTTSLAFYLVYGRTSATASNIGFILSVSASFSDTILWWVRNLNSFEVRSNSLERIQQYLDIEHEPEPKDGGRPPAYWPSSGDLRVEKLSARYSMDGPMVLHAISFHARAGERIGVVGRTGSGKSTLTLAMLRCIYTEGAVIYDGIPTDTLNLDALRSNVTIIPQMPELLGGTLRHNLDMFGQHDDATLNDALRAAGLFSLQSAADEHRLTLDSPLLILDEATSAIDYDTDTVIQASLRTELKKDVTVITVAHRLQTIMDYDKILVLDAGRLVEFDAPKLLLQKEDSYLRALVEESAD